MKLPDILNVLQIIFSIIAVIAYWHLFNTEYMSSLYVKIGAGIAAHGALIGGIWHMIVNKRK
jgi:hypothetical protein